MPIPMRIITTILAGWMLAPVAAAAQAVAERTRIEAYWDEAGSASSTHSLDSLVTQWQGSTTGSLQRLGLAFGGLRRFELGDSTALYPAWLGFSRVVAAEPRWPWARLGLGYAALAMYRSRSDTPSEYDGGIGGTHFTGFVLQMQRILEREPDFAPAVALVTRVTYESGDRDQQKALIRLLQKTEARGDMDPDIQLVLARSARLNRRFDEATRYVEQYARWGGDKSLAQLELARMLAGQGRFEEAADAWYGGIDTPSPLRRAAYRSDLQWTAERPELVLFDSLPDDSLRAFAERFWHRRDTREIRRDGERLQEHLRRWDYVHHYYRVPNPERRTQFRQTFRVNLGFCLKDGPNTLDDLDLEEPARVGTDRAVERVLDHRALVYMRHGQALREVGGIEPEPFIDGIMVNNPSGTVAVGTTNGAARTGTIRIRGGGNPYAAWFYMMDGKPRVFYFQPDGALGLDAPRALVLNQMPNLDMLLRLQDVVPGYAKLAAQRQVNYTAFAAWLRSAAAPLTCMPGVVDFIQDLRESAAVALHTDSYLRRINEPLDAAIQAYAVGSPGTDGRALVAFAIPAGELERDSTTSDTAHASVQIETVALDSTGGQVALRDTTIAYAVPRSAKGGWIAGLLEVPLDRPATEIRALLLQGGEERGMLVSLPIAPAATAGLGMSDIVLGRATTTTAWRAPDRMVPVTPFGAMSAGEAVELYYELHGLAVGQEYRTGLTLTRSDEDRPGASLSFTDQAVAGRQGFTRRLTLAELVPGDYTLSIAVSQQAGGPEVRRERTIRVIR